RPSRENILSHSRRQFLNAPAASSAIIVLPRAGRAQTYPTRPVRWVVPYAAGGPTDIIARLMGPWVASRLGQQFIIENRPGAAGNVGTEVVVRSPPDGHTLISIGTPHAINPSLYDKLNLDVTHDIVPIAGI